MFAKINHIAIVSDNYAQLGKFYEAVFGMKNSPLQRATQAITVGDGYVGLNINPRRAGRSAGLDHFGIEVEDVETVFDRMRKRYPAVKWLKRPSNRPFAGVSTHDPDGNMFDLSQKNMANPTRGTSIISGCGRCILTTWPSFFATCSSWRRPTGAPATQTIISPMGTSRW